MLPLRNDQTTDDPRLDRLREFDVRSRAFPIRPTIEGRKPRSFTWACSVVLNQGQEGSCVGHACAHELAAKPAPVAGVTHQFARERIYWPAQRVDPWEGGAYPGASPFYEGTSVLAGMKVLYDLGAFAEYRWAFGLDDLILAVGYTGPAVIGVDWHEGMMSAGHDGFIHRTGSVVGGHAILVRGVSVRHRRFRLHNSWGAEWGQGGTAWLSFDDMAELLSAGGEAAIPIRRKRVAL